MNYKYPVLIPLQILTVLVLFCWFIKPILAAEYQNCSTSTNCTIGEFLYDDNYIPITTATCTITSRYPNSSLFVDTASMTAGTNGWYSYTAAIGTTEGIYPTQICCTTSPDYLCLDKTFKVVAPEPTSIAGATAAEVWAYPDRTVTSFGTLVADIWNYSTRSLTNFGDLVTNIWSHNGRSVATTNSAATLTSISEIKEIKTVVKENRLLLEQLVDKQVVKPFVDEVPLPNLASKLEQTKTAAANLYSGVQNLKSRSLILEEKWSTLSESEIKSELSTLSFILKQDINQKDSNILATTAWLKTSWNSPVLLNLSDQAQGAQSQIVNLLNDLNLYSIGANSKTFASAITHINKLDELVGTSLASAEDLTLYGFIKKTSDRIAFLDKQTAEGFRILTEINKDTKADLSSIITQYQSNILGVNQLPQVDSFLTKTLNKTGTPTNKVLGLMAIVDTNKLLLAANTGQTIKNIWLEEGSIIFRSVAVNPSHTTTQKVAIKYYLPSEIKKEQIISYDPIFTIDYDPTENALFAAGEVTLAPNETKTFQVEVEDIWNFKQEEIDSLKTSVNELTMALKGTPQFAQATAIKSDIVVALDQIMLRQAQAITPEYRIQAFRKSALEMNDIEEKINSLKELLIQSSTVGGFLGSIGGVQNITLWGIVLIVIAGFAFLTIYLNALRSDAKLRKLKQKEALEDPKTAHNNIYHPTPKYRHREDKHHRGRRIARIASIALLTGGLSSIGASFAIKTSQSRPMALVSPAADALVLGSTAENTYPYETSLKMPDSGKVPVRTSPAITASEIMSLRDVDRIYVFRIIDGWAQIGLSDKDLDKNWWLNTQYLVLK